MRIPSRTVAMLCLAMVATTTAVLVDANPAAADSYGGYATAGVNIRSGPGTGYSVVGSLPVNAQVHVYCVSTGTTVNGNNIWDHIGSGQYVADAYVYTGYDAPIAQGCGEPAPGYVDVSVVPGCGFAGSFANSNFGAARNPEAHWFEQSGSGCYNSIGAYYFTYGNGPTPSPDYVKWGYFPGAYARCDLSVALSPANGHVFDTSAHYQIVTGNSRGVVLRDVYVNQAGNAGVDGYPLGTYSADGSGYLGVKLLDSSPSTSTNRVVASYLYFDNCVTSST